MVLVLSAVLFALGTVGVPGWVLPHVAIIDEFGLNDRVVARTPRPARSAERLMAHDRGPPPGYVECFLPDLSLRAGGGIEVHPRTQPLTERRIQECERSYWERVR